MVQRMIPSNGAIYGMFVTMNRDIKIIALFKNSYETSVNWDLSLRL
jgi:homospermidine synthase